MQIFLGLSALTLKHSTVRCFLEVGHDCKARRDWAVIFNRVQKEKEG